MARVEAIRIQSSRGGVEMGPNGSPKRGRLSSPQTHRETGDSQPRACLIANRIRPRVGQTGDQVPEALLHGSQCAVRPEDPSSGVPAAIWIAGLAPGPREATSINLPPVGHAEGPLAGLSLTEILDQVDAGQLSLAKLIGQYSDRGGVLSRQRERQTLQAPTSPVASAVFNFGTIISEQDAPRRSD